MKITSPGIMCHSDDRIEPGVWFGQIRRQLPHRILPERVHPPTATHSVYSDFLVFAYRTELLHADEIRYVQLSSVCVPRILGPFKIIEYVQYLITRGVAARPSGASYNTGDLFICSAYSYGRTACYIRDLRASRPNRTPHNTAYVSILIFFEVLCL